MKTKNLIIIFLLILIIVLGNYIIFNKQKKNVIIETTTTTKLALCSNEYYKTEYHAKKGFYPGIDVDGRIVIKDFPYREVADDEDCKENEKSDIRMSIGGCCPEEGDDNITKLCYYKNISLKNISDLSCVQKITLSGIWSPGTGNYNINNCFFENDDLNYLSNMVNLESITFDSCGNKNINNGWWKNFKNLKEISIIDSTPTVSDNLLDDILPIIEKIPTIESVSMGYGMLGLSWYQNKDKLCSWINKWENIKTIYASGEIMIKNTGEFVEKSSRGEETKSYANCEEWVAQLQKQYEEESGN